jgi:formyltetrahydrofolate synthetase
MNDRGLAHIVTGLRSLRTPLRETGFDLTAASEVMAILALAADLHDLRARLGRIVAGSSFDGRPVTAEMLGAAGAMAALLRDAVRPNLVQTCEHTPAIVHAGPFGNIAHGNSSIIADRIALRLADYVVTESGFGADCGAEKFVHIKCRTGGLAPDAFVLVCTVRALKVHSGGFRIRPGKPLPQELAAENLDALRSGAANLQAHLEILRHFGVPVVVAVNRFPTDTERELREVRDLAYQFGAASVSVTDCFVTGSQGANELAVAVVDACRTGSDLRMLYRLDAPLCEKFTTIARDVYGADGVDFAPDAERQLERLTDAGYGNLPVCIAKTQYSLSHDPARLGRPRGFRVPIHDVRLAAGAGYIYGAAGEIVTMPGLPAKPAAVHIDLAENAQIIGMV